MVMRRLVVSGFGVVVAISAPLFLRVSRERRRLCYYSSYTYATLNGYQADGVGVRKGADNAASC